MYIHKMYISRRKLKLRSIMSARLSSSFSWNRAKVDQPSLDAVSSLLVKPVLSIGGRTCA